MKSKKDYVVELTEKEAYNFMDEHWVAELVRCENCQFYNEGQNEVDAWMRCRLHNINTDQYQYCSWAVKKEDA